jgi:hypothetical protein
MSLIATTRAAVETAFAAAGDLIVSVTWTRQTIGAYNATAGTETVTAATRTVRAVEGKVEAMTATKLALTANAVRLFVPAVDFEASPAIDPQIDDKLTHRGKTYTVRSAGFEGTKALFEVHADQ